MLSASTDRRPASAGLRLGRVEFRDLAVLGAFALVLRAAWALVYGRVEGGAGDAPFFAQVAVSVAHGDGFALPGGAATAQAPPGFPALLALLYKAFGVHVKMGLALNVALGAATAMLLYLLGGAALGRAGGIVAGALYAILPSAIFFTGALYSETTLLFLVAGFLALAVFLPDRVWTPVLLGVVAGLATLVKGDGALLAVVPAAIWWGSRPRRVWLRQVALVLLALALTVLPWTIRNAVAIDTFAPVATNDAAALWSGHNANANGSSVAVPGRPPGELRREALSWAVRHPHKELGLIPRRILALGGGASALIRYAYNDEAEQQLGTSSALVFSVLADAGDYLVMFLFLAALVLLGARTLWRANPVIRGALAYIGASILVYGIFYYGQFRYRMPMLPLLVLVATALVVTAWQQRATLREESA